MIAMMAFIPIFFFASEHAQISLHDPASNAGIFLFYFFIGFVILAQVGGRMLDREGAEAGGGSRLRHCRGRFLTLGSKATTLSFFSKQQFWVILAGSGVGMMLGPANTDAVNRAGNLSYGEVTASPRPSGTTGPVSAWRARDDPALQLPLAPDDVAAAHGQSNAHAVSEAHGSHRARGSGSATPSRLRLARLRPATATVLYVMCGIMALAAVVALFGLQRGRQEAVAMEAEPHPVGRDRLTASPVHPVPDPGPTLP